MLGFFLEAEGSSSQTSSPPPSSSSVFPGTRTSVPSRDFLDQFTQVKSPNSEDSKHRDAGAVLPFVGLTSSESSADFNTDPPKLSCLLEDRPSFAPQTQTR